MMEQVAYATAPPVLYELFGVEKSCEGPAGHITILKNMDLTVCASGSLTIVGVSESDKSTFLRLLGALDMPTAGKVLFEGRSLSGMTPVERAHFHNKRLGFVFQFHHPLPEFSTEENVVMQALIAGVNRSKALGLTRQALKCVGLSDRKNHRVTILSGGKRQRTTIARAILLEPRVLLVDEPTDNLGQRTGDPIAELLLELNRTLGMTLVIVTHNCEMAGTLGRYLELRSEELYEEMRARAVGVDAV